MSEILFASDLDNTLLFTQKHLPEDADKVCVEYYQEKPHGFFTTETIRLLREVCRQTQFVPITTRSLEQYRRITWPEGCSPKLALTTNGSLLLINGEVDEAWQHASLEMVRLHAAELGRLYAILSPNKAFIHCRLVDQMYLFVSCEDEAAAAREEARCREMTSLTVEASGRKIYFFPPGIDKGTALERLRKRFLPRKIFCAGDSRIDLPMLGKADTAFVPQAEMLNTLPRGILFGQGMFFPENLLQHVMELSSI